MKRSIGARIRSPSGDRELDDPLPRETCLTCRVANDPRPSPGDGLDRQAHAPGGNARALQCDYAASRRAASSGDSASFFSARCSSCEARSAEKPSRLPIAVSVWGSSRPVPKRKRQHRALGFGQLGDRTVHDALALVVPGGLLGRLGVRGQQVAERGVAVLADLLVEADERQRAGGAPPRPARSAGPSPAASSSIVGSRPRRTDSSRSTRPTLRERWATWTGRRIVRPEFSRPRWIAWRIHRVA